MKNEVFKIHHPAGFVISKQTTFKDIPAKLIEKKIDHNNWYYWIYFKILSDTIEKNGKKSDEYESINIVYSFNNLQLLYKIPKKGLGAISVTDAKNKIFYWVIKEESSISIQTKDYPANIGEQKQIEAKEHFCNLINSIN